LANIKKENITELYDGECPFVKKEMTIDECSVAQPLNMWYTLPEVSIDKTLIAYYTKDLGTVYHERYKYIIPNKKSTL